MHDPTVPGSHPSAHLPCRRRGLLVALALALAVFLPALAAPAATDAASAYHVPVLMYHRVSPTIDPGSAYPDLVVTPATFSAQMKALHAAGWHTITAAQLGAAIKAHTRIASRTFVITFDDGRDDGYVYAYPILRKYGFTATYYVITGRIGRSRYLSWAQLATMAKHGMEIGNHTVSHTAVSSVHGTALANAINRAAATIVTHLAALGVTVRVTTFAYPYGSVSTEAHNLLRARGYTLALTEVHGLVNTLKDPLYAPRIRVSRGESARGLLASM